MSVVHELKTWPSYFKRVENGQKTFEVRRMDRNFMVGDFLNLKEYDPEERVYTGEELTVVVTYLLEGGQFGIEPGYCVMGIKIDY